MMNDNIFRKLFLIAAVYDLVLGVIFLTMYKQVYAYLDITLPNYPMYLQLSAAFVIAIGIAYYYVYKDMYKNIDMVKLGIIYKAIYAAIAGYYFFIGVAHVLFFWFGVCDVVFLALFVWFLVWVGKEKRNTS